MDVQMTFPYRPFGNLFQSHDKFLHTARVFSIKRPISPKNARTHTHTHTHTRIQGRGQTDTHRQTQTKTQTKTHTDTDRH